MAASQLTHSDYLYLNVTMAIREDGTDVTRTLLIKLHTVDSHYCVQEISVLMSHFYSAVA